MNAKLKLSLAPTAIIRLCVATPTKRQSLDPELPDIFHQRITLYLSDGRIRTLSHCFYDDEFAPLNELSETDTPLSHVPLNQPNQPLLTNLKG